MKQEGRKPAGAAGVLQCLWPGASAPLFLLLLRPEPEPLCFPGHSSGSASFNPLPPCLSAAPPSDLVARLWPPANRYNRTCGPWYLKLDSRQLFKAPWEYTATRCRVLGRQRWNVHPGHETLRAPLPSAQSGLYWKSKLNLGLLSLKEPHQEFKETPEERRGRWLTAYKVASMQKMQKN